MSGVGTLIWVPPLIQCMDAGLYVYPLRTGDASCAAAAHFNVVLPGEEKFCQEVREKLHSLLSAYVDEANLLFYTTEVEHPPSGIRSVYVSFHHK